MTADAAGMQHVMDYLAHAVKVGVRTCTRESDVWKRFPCGVAALR